MGCMAAGRPGATMPPRISQLSPICRRCVGDWGFVVRRQAEVRPAYPGLRPAVPAGPVSPGCAPVSAGMVGLWWPEATPVKKVDSSEPTRAPRRLGQSADPGKPCEVTRLAG
jgi:hypothetical protein